MEKGYNFDQICTIVSLDMNIYNTVIGMYIYIYIYIYTHTHIHIYVLFDGYVEEYWMSLCCI